MPSPHVDLELVAPLPRANPLRKRDRSGPTYRDFLVRTALVRAPGYDPHKAPRITTAAQAAKLVAHLGEADQEHLVVICLNFQHRLLAVHEAAIGGTSSVAQANRHVLKVPFLTGASYVYLVHNHPSGSLKPSRADLLSVVRRQAAFQCVGITLEDSVIVAGTKFTSLKKLGFIQPPATKR